MDKSALNLVCCFPGWCRRSRQAERIHVPNLSPSNWEVPFQEKFAPGISTGPSEALPDTEEAGFTGPS